MCEHTRTYICTCYMYVSMSGIHMYNIHMCAHIRTCTLHVYFEQNDTKI